MLFDKDSFLGRLFANEETRRIHQGILDYLEVVDKCLDTFEEAVHLYLEEGFSSKFEDMDKKTHSYESAADDKRREIELTMYGRALLPESRGDILGLLESYDKLPGTSEGLLAILLVEKPKIPQWLKEDFVSLLDINRRAAAKSKEAMIALMEHEHVKALTDEVDSIESESDKLQMAMLHKVFDSDLELSHKYQMKSLISKLGSLSDRCEDVANRIEIVAVKRKI